MTSTIETTTKIDLYYLRALAALAVVASLLVVLAAKPAHAETTFTVNFEGDQGDINLGDGVCDVDFGANTQVCTLRAAIQEANRAPGADVINFNITGSSDGIATIFPNSQLPTITDPVTIDGYTQPGASPNTLAQGGTNAVLKIELAGINAGSGASGLRIDAGGSGSVVKGLAINRFGFNGVFMVSDSNQNKIEGNFIGTDLGGTFDLGNGGSGVDISQVNLFTSNTVGGNSPAARNLISGNGEHGVLIAGSKTTGNDRVLGNLIGTKKDGITALGNSSIGVAILGSSNSTVSANTIAFNGRDGVVIGQCGTGNPVLGNSIFSNSRLGIDLVGEGVTANDSLDKDTGANNLQNFPVITSAKTSRKGTTITGTLNSTPNQGFLVQFFSNASDNEGQTFIGSVIMGTDSDGKGAFTFKPAQKVPKGQFITATATNFSSADTSEFSAAKKVVRKR